MKATKLGNKSFDKSERKASTNSSAHHKGGFNVNKSIDKYINEKFKGMDEFSVHDVKNETEPNHNSSNAFASLNNSKGAVRNASKNAKFNSSFSSNVVRKYVESKMEKEEERNLSKDLLMATPTKEKKISQLERAMNETPNSQKNIIQPASPLKEYAFESDQSPINKNENKNISSEKLELIKKSLIELVNETKDKQTILKELDSIYKNIFKVSNPLSQNNVLQNLEEDSTNLNLNFTRCMSNFILNDNINLNNTSQYSQAPSTSLSKPSNANVNHSNKELESASESLNSNLQTENDSLRKENNLLKKKIEEIDKKFEKLFQQNQDLKGFVETKTESFENMTNLIKKLESDLEQIKRGTFIEAGNMNSTYTGKIIQNNKKSANLFKKENNDAKTKEAFNNKMNIKALNVNQNKAQVQNILQNRKSFSGVPNKDKLEKWTKNKNKNKMKTNEYSVSKLPEPTPYATSYADKRYTEQLNEPSLLLTTMSIESLRAEDAKGIYYYPVKVKNQTKMNSNVLPKISIQEMFDDKIVNSPLESGINNQKDVDLDSCNMEGERENNNNNNQFGENECMQNEESFNYSLDSNGSIINDKSKLYCVK